MTLKAFDEFDLEYYIIYFCQRKPDRAKRHIHITYFLIFVEMFRRARECKINDI
jgi:hypothetical protein